MKAPLVKELKLELRGVPPLASFAAKLVLGLELRHLKTALGYVGGGSWNNYRGEVRPAWVDFCKAQGGMTETAERILHQCCLVVKARLARAGTQEAAEVLALMETPPSKLSDADRKRLVEGILRHALVEGETQQDLRREFAAEQPAAIAEPPTVSGRDERALSEIERQRLELMALGMGCGLNEKQARQVANIMFAHRFARFARKHAPEAETRQPGRDQQ